MTQLIRAGKQLLDIANGVQYTSAGKAVLDSAGAVKFLRAGKLLFDTNGFLQYIKNGKLYVGKDATLTAYSSDSTGKITTSFEDARTSDLYVPDHEGMLHAIPGGTVAFEGARVVRNEWYDSENISLYNYSSRFSSLIQENGYTKATTSASAASGEYWIRTNSFASSKRIIVSVDAKQGTTPYVFVRINGVTSYCSFDLSDGTIIRAVGCTAAIKDNGDGSYRLYAIADSGVGVNYPSFGLTDNIGGLTVTSPLLGGLYAYFNKSMFQYIDGQSNINPSEYIQAGTGLPGIAFYTTQNGNTVDANGVVTEAVGAPITTPIKMVHAPAATNLFLYSTEYENLDTGIGDVDIVASGIASRVSSSARLITARAGLGYKFVRSFLGDINGIAHTVQCVAKKDTHRYIGLRPGTEVGGMAHIAFDFDTGSFVNTGSISTEFDSWGAVDLGGGWWYLYATGTPVNTAYRNGGFSVCDSTGAEIWSSAGTESIIVDGFQCEASAFSTPLIPTSGATASRDICQIRAPYAGAFNQSEGVAYVEWEPGASYSDFFTEANQQGIIGVRSNGAGVIGVASYGTPINGHITSTDGTSWPDINENFLAGTHYHVVTRWKTGDTFQIGLRKKGTSSWTWSTALSYDGSFTTDELFIRLFYPNYYYNNNLHNLEILNKDIGTTAIEDRYSLAKVG